MSQPSCIVFKKRLATTRCPWAVADDRAKHVSNPIEITTLLNSKQPTDLIGERILVPFPWIHHAEFKVPSVNEGTRATCFVHTVKYVYYLVPFDAFFSRFSRIFSIRMWWRCNANSFLFCTETAGVAGAAPWYRCVIFSKSSSSFPLNFSIMISIRFTLLWSNCSNKSRTRARISAATASLVDESPTELATDFCGVRLVGTERG
jgi:hypothetical protein